MSLLLRAILLSVICSLLVSVTSCATMDSPPEDESAASGPVRDVADAEASPTVAGSPERTFAVSEVKITGNTLISTEELLAPFYADKEKDPNTQKTTRVVGIDDFEVL